MVFLEIVILLFIVLIFFVTDSRTIHIAGENFLNDYNISYKKISGNFFSGLEIKELKYQEETILQSAKIHWNPIALTENRIEITKLDINGMNSSKIVDLLKKIPSSSSSDDSSKRLDFDLLIKGIDLSFNPFLLYGVSFEDIHLKSNQLSIDRDLHIKSDLLDLSLDSEIANLELHGLFEDHNLNLSEVHLLKIDPKAITRLVRNIKRTQKETPQTTQNPPKSSKQVTILEKINIDNFVATMKKTTYNPITIDKTKVVAKSLVIDPLHGFDYSAKEATLLAQTTFATTKQVGYIKNSMFYGKGDLIPTPYLFARYHLPFNQKVLHKLPTRLALNHQGLTVEIDHNFQNLLALKGSDFNINMRDLKHKLTYRYLDFFIKIHSQGEGSISYADEVRLDNSVLIDFRERVNTTYEGKVTFESLKNLPKEITDNLLEHLQADYHGSSRILSVDINSKQLQGKLLSKGYQNATLQLNSRGSVPLSKLFLEALPKGLSHAKGELSSHSIIDFKEPSKSLLNLDIDSNLLNVKAKMKLTKPYKINYQGTLPKNSLLYQFDPHLKLSAIKSFDGVVQIEDHQEDIYFHAKDIEMSLIYKIAERRLASGLLNLDHQKISFDGVVDKGINLSANIKEIGSLFDLIERYYDISLPPLSGSVAFDVRYHPHKETDITLESSALSHPLFQGDISAKAVISKEGVIDINWKTKALSLLGDGEVKQRLQKISAKILLRGEEIEIVNYGLSFVGNPYLKYIHSQKPSYLRYHNGILESKKLWIDDQILVSGSYNLEKLKGRLYAKSDHFVYKNREFDLRSRLDLKLNLDHEKVYIFGNIKLLGDQIRYEVLGSGISEDSDIIIVQEQMAKAKSSLNNIKTYITIENEVPIKYLSKDIDIDLVNEITLIKEYNKDIRLLGLSRVVGGYYQQEEKRFYLAGSEIYFYGDPKKPILEIRANYQKDKYDINIYISGSSDDPIINFSSEPYLSQREILSLILFDTATSETGRGTAVYAMLGGTFAKELMKSLGVNVDHLLLGEGINDTLSVEVGQKISDKITVIYQHENGKDGVKMRVDHSKNFETDIIIQPPNTSSIEFLYKSD